MKKRSAYDAMNASDLARVTRERGLEKPKVLALGEWADFLEADDIKRQTLQTDADRDEEDADAPKSTSVDALKSKSSKGKL